MTGVTSGIGKEIALGLAKSGAHVIMVCRNLKRGQIALQEIMKLSGSKSIDLLVADMSSQSSICALAKTIHERYSRIDILVNNAGCWLKKKLFSVDGIEMTLATNYLGPLLLSYLLIDLLKKGAPSRIINITSDMHKWAKIDLDDLQFKNRKYTVIKAYTQSKLLLNIMTFELSRRLSGTGISVNCIHPGAVKTELVPLDNKLLRLINEIIKFFFFLTPKQAAKPILALALDQQFENITGQYFKKTKNTRASSTSYDPILAEKVWELSKKLIHCPGINLNNI